MNPRITIAGLCLLLLAACAATTGPFAYKNGILTNAAGHTLYVYAKDAPGKSNCNGACAAEWPPYLVTDGTGGGVFGIITRDDGAKQWAYSGQPLYFHSTDFQPGDRKGGGRDGVWSVVRARPEAVPARSSDGGY